MKLDAMVRNSVAFLMVASVAACGDSSSGPDYADVMTAGMAGDIGETSLYGTQDAFQGMDFGYAAVGIGAPAALVHPGHAPRYEIDPRRPEGLRAALQLANADGCSTSASGTDGDPWNPYDGNENGIPDDWTVSVTCVVSDTPSVGVTRVETIEQGMRIKEHSTQLWGFDASSFYRSHEVYSNGDDEDWKYELLHNVSVTPDAASAKYRVHYWQKYLDDGVPHDEDQEFKVDLAFDPDGTISAEAGALPDGELTITGSAHEIDPTDVSYRFDFSTPEPWLYSHECWYGAEEQPFVGGVLLARFNGNDEVGYTITWGACGNGFDFSTFGGEGVPGARPFLIRGWTPPRS